MPADNGQIPHPTKPSDGGRAIRFHAVQAIGVPLLALIPLLALFSTFGATHETQTASEGPLALEVRHPTRFRYKTIQPLEIVVRNQGDTALQDVSIWIDKHYLDAFSTVTFTPSPQRVTNDAYLFELGAIPAGDAQTVDGIVQAERYWSHSGRITAGANGNGQASINVTTLTFP